MLSKIEYTAPQYIVDDKVVTIQVFSIKNGVQSDAKEIQLTAKAVAPVAPEYSETITGAPNSYIEFSVNTEPNTTIEIVSCSLGTASVNGNNIKITFGDLDDDAEVALVIKAIRGKFESPELTINGNVVIPVPQEPNITGPAEVDEKQTADFILTNPEADVTYEATATGGNIVKSGDKFIFTAPDIEADTEVTLTFKATRKSKVSQVTKVIQVKNVLGKSVKLEIQNTGELKVLKDSDLVINFTNANGTLKVTNKSEYYGTAVVEGSTIKVTGVNNGTANFEVTQTEEDKAESDVLAFSVKVYEVSAQLIAKSSNPAEVKVNEDIVLEFTNANGELAVNADTEFVNALVQDSTIKVQGIKVGNASIAVTQTEEGKEPSEALNISIEVKAAEVVKEKSATLELQESQALTTEIPNTLDIVFKNLTGTLSANITEGENFGSIATESNKIVLTPTAAGSIKISAQQTENDKTISDALEITITITAQPEVPESPDSGESE